jgi:hypothetical protein
MPLYFYELKQSDGNVLTDEQPENHADDTTALAYGKRVASELARHAPQPMDFIIVKNEAQSVLGEIALSSEGL